MALKQTCAQVRDRIETAAERASAGWSEDPQVQRHLVVCTACEEYAGLQSWSCRVIEASQVEEIAPPLMSAVWASIHRASEQAWDRALSRSFRNLLPYMVAGVALVLLLGGLSSNPAATPGQAANTAYSVLNSPEVPAVAGVMSSASLSTQDPADLMGGGH